MMRLLLLSGSLLTAVVGYAQNTATVTQNGTSQTATANQTGTGHRTTISQVGDPAANRNNKALSTQNGQNQTATVNQNGNPFRPAKFNEARIDQSGTGATGNTATVSQNNSGGTSYRGSGAAATGDGNYGSVFQRGNNNTATVNQNDVEANHSSKNLGIVNQYGTGNGTSATGPVTITQNGATDGRAEINQGTASMAVTGNGATVDQTSSQRNDAFVNQLTSNNKATVLQSGVQSSDNVASIRQGSMDNTTGGGNTAIIQQETNTPEPPSTGVNTSFSTFNQAYITQLGTNSYADIKQRKDADQNYAEINQYSGTNSDARIQQEFQATSLNDARINQYGNNQLAYAAQIKADQNRLTIDQGSANVSSSANKAYVFQSFSDDGVVTVRQNTTTAGGQNFAEVTQEFNPAADPDRTVGNIATVDQEGSQNRMALRQSGVGSNTATIGQSGNNNVVKGPGLVANVTVPGFRPDVPIGALQDGFGNEMTVTQTSPGGTNSTIFNTADLTQRGNNNTLSVDQTAMTVGNSTTISQTGNSNQAVVQQNGMTP